MASCSSSITNILVNNLLNTVPVMEHNVPLNVSFLGFSNTIVRLQVPSNDSIRFQLNITSSNSIIDCQVTFYSLNLINNTFTNIGGLSTQEAITVFQKDLLEGDYLICLYSNNIATHSGTFKATFSNFVPYAKLQFNGYYGNVLTSILSFPTVERPCDKPLYYELIEGALPEGISMNHSGVLYGTLPNLDCMPSNINLSPSANWYTQLDNGEGYPWGRQYRFKIRVTVQGFPSTIKDEKWVSIRIYNNWDLEKKNFMSQMPFQFDYTVAIENEPVVLPETLCPVCTTESNSSVSLVTTEPCIDCLIPPYTDYQLIRIPLTLSFSNALDWYNENKDIQFSDTDIIRFLNELNSSEMFKMILWKQGIIKSEHNTGEFYKNMSFAINQVNDFLEIETNIMNKDVHGVERNAEDLDMVYLENKHSVNKVLPLEFIAWHR